METAALLGSLCQSVRCGAVLGARPVLAALGGVSQGFRVAAHSSLLTFLLPFMVCALDLLCVSYMCPHFLRMSLSCDFNKVFENTFVI